MSPAQEYANLTPRQLIEKLRSTSVDVSPRFAYFSATVPAQREELKEYVEEPVSALPPGVLAALPHISLLLVPFLVQKPGKERQNSHPAPVPAWEKPGDGTLVPFTVHLNAPDDAVLLIAIQDEEVADYHYRLYHGLATILADRDVSEAVGKYAGLLREEFTADMHGEVDEESWRLKQTIKRRAAPGGRDSKQFQAYARQSFIDTMTLYLHGICCDIDVETGPRQLPSRFLRKRLQLLQSLFPPPAGYVVFPEEL